MWVKPHGSLDGLREMPLVSEGEAGASGHKPKAAALQPVQAYGGPLPEGYDMNTYRSSDGQHWEPAEPLGWQEEHPWPVRVIYAVLGISHCGKKGWRR